MVLRSRWSAAVVLVSRWNESSRPAKPRFSACGLAPPPERTERPEAVRSNQINLYYNAPLHLVVSLLRVS